MDIELKKQFKIRDLLEGKFSYTKKGKGVLINPCPLCNHKDHFYIFESNNFFYSFGCGKSGDVIEFLKAYKGMDDKEALTYIDKGKNIPNRKKHSHVAEEKLIDQKFIKLIQIIKRVEKLKIKYRNDRLNYWVADMFFDYYSDLFNSILRASNLKEVIRVEKEFDSLFGHYVSNLKYFVSQFKDL